ncbi:MAG: ABC transporter ATP-binding protein, partial [Alicyclobacillus sp.]|nr:ABC transporter ATP-binding protein [Alicyclobacillus sp.]
SGCGKSTTLRMVNRLIEPSSGTIYINGQDYMTMEPVALRRQLGYVIQQIGLMPHLTIAENISFVLKLKGVPQSARHERARELLRMVNMDPDVYALRFPRELSGGQQQRIGVLRALAHNPDIILMDEPFGALDPLVREQLQDELKRLQREVHKTILFVTHDMDEALRIADRIVLMREGRIVQAGTPEEILRRPSDEFVANFIGHQRILRQASEVCVGELMVRAVTIDADQGMAQALELMRRRTVDSLIVQDSGGAFVGVVRADDVQAALASRESGRVRTIAKHREAFVRPYDVALKAMHLMLMFNLDAIPVVAPNGEVSGVITRGTLVGVLNNVLQITEFPQLAASNEG